MHKTFGLLVAVSAAALGVASAQDKEGFYGEIGAGFSADWGERDFESEGVVVPQAFDSSLELDDGIAIYGALGRYFPNGLRSEFELSYRVQDVESLPGDGTFGGFPSQGDLGDVNVLTGMINVIKDFQLAERVTPYLGAGVGFARIALDVSNVSDQNAATSGADFGAGYNIVLDDDDYVTAVQGLAGVSFALQDNVSLDIGYRYLQTGEYDLDGTINAEAGSVSGEYLVHEFTGGLRIDFGTKAVAPVQEPQPRTRTCADGTIVSAGAPCPIALDEGLTPQELALVVYFEYDSATLTEKARQAIARRARQAEEVDLIQVIVIGNTDTAGDAGYNQRLSQRRGAVVRNALTSYGVDGQKIQVRALGETSPAKPTADGVQEPLNRRTEVEFQF
ncbi:MAG: OmpA family protein [Pseudomonadota bacterium]